MSEDTEKKSIPPIVVVIEKGMKEWGGSEYLRANGARLNQLVQTLWYGACHSAEEKEKLQKAAFLTMHGISPQDDLEGMLAAQMVATNAAVMECFRRAMLDNQTFEGMQQNFAFANKLSRTYAQQVETLQRYRGKGQQKMTVEHVHVHAGGQAIVGNVAGGGGVQQKTEEQPHAKQIDRQPPVYAPMSTMPCANEEKEPLPVPCDAKR